MYFKHILTSLIRPREWSGSDLGFILRCTLLSFDTTKCQKSHSGSIPFMRFALVWAFRLWHISVRRARFTHAVIILLPQIWMILLLKFVHDLRDLLPSYQPLSKSCLPLSKQPNLYLFMSLYIIDYDCWNLLILMVIDSELIFISTCSFRKL